MNKKSLVCISRAEQAQGVMKGRMNGEAGIYACFRCNGIGVSGERLCSMAEVVKDKIVVLATPFCSFTTCIWGLYLLQGMYNHTHDLVMMLGTYLWRYTLWERCHLRGKCL
jgi:hypothetical protein